MSRPFVVQLQNRPGELAHLARALAARGIDIRQIAGGGAGRTYHAVLDTDDDAATREVLRNMGYSFVEGAAIVVEAEDRPGTLAELSERLAAADVNIEGVLIVGRRGTQVEIAFAVDDEKRAREALGLTGTAAIPRRLASRHDVGASTPGRQP